MHELLAAQRSAFRRAPLSLGDRLDALERLSAGVRKEQGRLEAAVNADFGNRSPRETALLEIFPLLDEIRHVRRRLRGWTRPRRAPVNWQFWPSRARIVYQPLGVVGVIGTWNYPVLLTLSPLVSALAAGNHVMIKPSEHAPMTAEAVRALLAELFPPEQVAVVEGDAQVAEAFAALPFDHLLFTGSTRIGRLVMKAAAEHLTPVTLELGGKSPALVHESFPLAAAAERIGAAKLWNGGQTCIAPDYALVPQTKLDAFVREVETLAARRYPHLARGGDYTHLISAAAWHRMQRLVEDAREKGARVIEVNPAHERFAAEGRAFPPTLIAGANDTMRVMHEEIFGPVLPVAGYSTLEEALEYVNARPRPLALYYFDRDPARIRRVVEVTTSGGVTVNDCMYHFPQHALPFGGVGPSGMGAYHGFAGFEAFSHKKAVLLQSRLTGSAFARLLSPPYGPRTDRLLRFLIRDR